MSRPQIKITLIDRKGKHGCHRGHKIGDSFDFDTERGQLCPMAMHVAFPYIDILRYGGHLPGQEDGTAVFCCPDVRYEQALLFMDKLENKRVSHHLYSLKSERLISAGMA